jgi:hypothetical protein
MSVPRHTVIACTRAERHPINRSWSAVQRSFALLRRDVLLVVVRKVFRRIQFYVCAVRCEGADPAVVAGAAAAHLQGPHTALLTPRRTRRVSLGELRGPQAKGFSPESCPSCLFVFVCLLRHSVYCALVGVGEEPQGSFALVRSITAHKGTLS